MTDDHRIAAVLVAAGRGVRAGGGLPKQWRELGDRSVAAHALAAFRDHPRIGPVVLVLDPQDYGMAAGWLGHSDMIVAEGGASRTASVRSGLESLDGMGIDRVLIHDAARPLVTDALIDRVIDALDHTAGAAPGLPVVDALWSTVGDMLDAFRDRTALVRAQTPQGFRFDAILAAHRTASGEAYDDVAIARAAGMDVRLVEGDERNIKITGPDDFARAEAILEAHMDIRTGNGFDVHAFTDAGRDVTLCGIAVPHDRTLTGHSDADVGMHALADAIYGALAEGDIGRHFPPSDPEWKGAPSEIFLGHAARRAIDRGYRIANIDVTLVCEAPKIAPHADRMAKELSRIVGVDAERVSVKATTSEGLGFAGRGEGIAAFATATLVKP
jgi:2-C-methyl-D-erythritol 4-phosphate cytidylyltransferase / 2-C-methyl-D-erythritol 2,4-cyclodiphosphate synthase